MSFVINISDFDKICRICLNFIDKSVAVTLFNIIEMVTECTSIQVDAKNKMPDQVCKTCLNQIQNAFNLRKLSEKSETELKNILENHYLETPITDTNFESDSTESYNEKEKYSCKTSTENFENSNDYDLRMKNKHNKESLTCQICKKEFSKRYLFNKHKISHISTKPYECTKCENAYKSRWSLNNHIASVHTETQKKVVCDTCGKSVRAKSLQLHLTLHNKRSKFPCKFCPKKLFSEKTLNEHVKIIHEKIPRKYSILCNICGIGIKSKAALKEHLHVHTGEKPFACDKCEKKYRTKTALKVHVTRAHLDKRHHICKICSRGFYDKIILENHARTHTGERPFVCKICEKTFSFKAALRTHMKVHLN